MMRLNLENVSTLLSFGMLSTVPTSVSSAESDLFESHLKHAGRDTDRPSEGRSEPLSASRRSKKERNSEPREASHGRAEATNSGRELADQRVDRLKEDDAEADAELDAADAEADVELEAADAEAEQQQEEESREHEEVAAEAVVALPIPVEFTSATVPVEASVGEAEVAEATDPIAETMTGAPKLPGRDGPPLDNDATEQAMLPAEGPTEPVVEGAAAKDEVATAEEPVEKTPPTSEEDASRVPAGESLFGSGTDGQGASGGSETPDEPGDEALMAASQLRTDARRHAGRQKHDRLDQDASNQPSNEENQAAPTNAAPMSQTVPTEVVVPALPVPPEATNSAAPTTAVDRDGEVGGVRPTATDPPQRSASATPSEKTPGGEQVERVRFVQRVARVFESMGDRNGTIRMALSPPELGSLKLHLSVRNGAMEARVEVETESARNLLIENLPALRERLAEQNIKVERFDVDFMNRSTDGSPQDAGQQSQTQEQTRRGDRPSQSPHGRQQNTPAQTSPAARRGNPGRLDITI